MAKGKFIFILSLLTALGMVFNTSCSGPKYPKEIAMLDSIRVKLDSAEANLNSIDSTTVISAITEVNEDLQDISMHFHRFSKDSVMDRETATNITKYRSVRKAFGLYKKDHKKLRKDIDYSQAQVTNLIHDLEKNLVDDKDVSEYVNREKQEALKTVQVTNVLVASVKEMLGRYEESKPKVKEYIQSLKAGNKKGK